MEGGGGWGGWVDIPGCKLPDPASSGCAMVVVVVGEGRGGEGWLVGCTQVPRTPGVTTQYTS